MSLPFDPVALATATAPQVLRTSLDRSGYAHLDLGVSLDPRTFRRLICAVGRVLATFHQQLFGLPLQFHCASVFDQQSSTRPHRDGGPDQSVLLLGYEPTQVSSRLFLMDYTRAARDRRQTPQEYLDRHNPAFGGDERSLEACTIEVQAFDPGRYQLVIVNNSCGRISGNGGEMLGLLHHAQVTGARKDRSRVIDSVLLGVSESGLGEGELRLFEDEGKAVTL